MGGSKISGMCRVEEETKKNNVSVLKGENWTTRQAAAMPWAMGQYLFYGFENVVKSFDSQKKFF